MEDSEDEDDEPADIGHLNRIAASMNCIITYDEFHGFSFYPNVIEIYRELSREAKASLDLTNPDTLYEVLKKSARYLKNCDEEDYFDKAVSTIYLREALFSLSTLIVVLELLFIIGSANVVKSLLKELSRATLKTYRLRWRYPS